MEAEMAPGELGIRVSEGRKFRTVYHARQQGRFLQTQVVHRLAEIELRRRRESIISVREVHLIGVHGEDLRFGVAALNLQRQQHLLHFAAEAAVATIEEKVSG